ncbi:MAG: pitrilysin family protein [Anaerolineae bacterium]
MTAPISPENITRVVLDSGLVVLVKENHTNPSISFRGRMRAGAMYDTDQTAGLAQFAAAALNRGTKKYTFQKLNETLDRVGMSFGAGAGVDYLGFNGKCLQEDLDLWLGLASEVLLRPTFPEREVDKLRGQFVTSLRRAKQDTRWVASQQFHKLCYPSGHPYHRMDDGTEATLKRLNPANLEKFHNRFYRSEGALLVVVGDVTAKDVIGKIDKRLRWKVTGRPPAFGIPSIPLRTAPARKDVHIPGKIQSDIVIGNPGIARNDPDFYALRAADLIFGQLGLFGRLGEVIRDKLGLAYYVYSSLNAGVGAGPWSINAGVNPRNIDQAVEGIIVEIDRLRTQGITEDELAHGQDFLTGSLALRLETNDGVAATLADIEFYGLGLDYIERYPGIIRGLTVDQVRAAVDQHAHPETAVTVVAGPIGKAAG